MIIGTTRSGQTYFAFRGQEFLVRPDGRADPLGFHPFPDREAGNDPWLLDSFPLRVSSLSDTSEKCLPPIVLSLSPEAEAPEGLAWVPFRSVLAGQAWDGVLPACRALSLAQWRSVSRFCGRCGSAQRDKADETARLCPSCGHVTYPRLSPAILARVHRGGRILLARNAAFKSGIFSVLAGFVEPGESFEDCVVREVEEEVGIRVRNVRYLGSQPWPFPDSLMVGFEAEWESGELSPDGIEIAEAGWYGPDDHPPLPLPGSLSRRIIDAAFKAPEVRGIEPI